MIAVAASGPESAKIAAELGDGLFAVEPDGELVRRWHGLGGHGPAYGEMSLAWADDEDQAVQAVLEKNAFALAGLEGHGGTAQPGQLRGGHRACHADPCPWELACGPDPKRHLEVAREFVNAGFDHLVAMNAGPDPDAFMDFFARELAAPLRALTPAAA